MKHIKKWLLISGILFTSVIGLNACGGGGGGSSSTGSGGGGGSSSTGSGTTDYVFFTSEPNTQTTGPGALDAYDPDTGSISKVATLDSLYSARGNNIGAIDPTTQIISNLHPDGEFYPSQGHVYYIKTAKSGALTPTQLSNYSYTGVMCNALAPAIFIFDEAAPNYFIMQDSGSDTTCGDANDSAFHAFDPAMTATSPVITLTGIPIAALISSKTSSVNAVLSIDSSASANMNLIVTDQNGANPVTLQAGISNVPTVLARGDDSALLDIDGTLKIYSAATQQLSGSLYTISSEPSVQSDGKNYYFFDGANLYAVPVDGSASATLVGTDNSGSGQSFNPIVVNSSGLLYLLGSGSDVLSIRVMNLATGNNYAIATSSTGGISLIGRDGTKVYYNLNVLDSNTNTTSYSALSADMTTPDSGDVVSTNANWTGPQLSSTESVWDNGYPNDVTMFLQQYTTWPSGSLSAYDAATGTLINTLATSVPGQFEAVVTGTTDYGFLSTSTANQFASVTPSVADSFKLIDSGNNIDGYPY